MPGSRKTPFPQLSNTFFLHPKTTWQPPRQHLGTTRDHPVTTGRTRTGPETTTNHEEIVNFKDLVKIVQKGGAGAKKLISNCISEEVRL